jgi:hypothetical protein
MNPVKIEGTAMLNASKYNIYLNGKSLPEILYKNLNCPEYKDIPAKISITIEPMELNVKVNGRPLDEDDTEEKE